MVNKMTLPDPFISNNQIISKTPFFLLLVLLFMGHYSTAFMLYNHSPGRSPYISKTSLYSYSTSNTDNDILLRMGLSSVNGKEALENTKKFLCKFPFAAVLPVQPLQYLPSENGVQITFLRKKTKEKGSEDGGMMFDVFLFPQEEEEENVLEDGRERLKIIGRRKTEGQTVTKIFSEKMVVQAIVKGLGDEQDLLGVRVESVFHQWL